MVDKLVQQLYLQQHRCSVCVYVQAKDTTGGTNTLTFNAAGDDVWATGSVIESRDSSEVTFDISAAGETQLVYN